VERWLGHAERALFVGALVVLLFGAAGGAWTGGSDHAVLASQLERSALAPLYSALAGAAAQLPIGEPWFRLAALNAVLGAVLLVGVARAARALLPKDPVAGFAAALALGITPPFRDAAGFPGPSILAACGVVWGIAFAIEHAREPGRERAQRTFAAIAVLLGSAPWLGLGFGAFVVGWLHRRTATRTNVVSGIGVLGALVVVLWLGADGSLPAIDVDLSAAIAAPGRGAAAVVLGAGLLGIAFAGVTLLPHARWVAGALAIVALHGVVVDHAPIVVLSAFAIGLAVIPSGIVRAVPNGPERRHLVAAVAGAPLVGAALLSGAAFAIDDPGHTPARVASDLTIALPPGPGVLASKRSASWSAIAYAQAVAGARPDLRLLAPIDRVPGADAVIANALRGGSLVGADVSAFGRLDLRLAYPRGRGYQLLLAAPPEDGRDVPAPAKYTSTIGEQLAVLAAFERARYEAGNGRLGAAARAAGLTERFGAGDLAILSTTAPSRPAFLGFIPQLDGLPPGAWMLDLFGDDLAWAAGLEPPVVEVPRERKLHGLWRALWRGEISPDDPSIAALGPDAVRATTELVDELTKKNRR